MPASLLSAPDNSKKGVLKPVVSRLAAQLRGFGLQFFVSALLAVIMG